MFVIFQMTSLFSNLDEFLGFVSKNIKMLMFAGYYFVEEEFSNLDLLVFKIHAVLAFKPYTVFYAYL